SWSLQQVPIERLWPHESECPGGRHGAHCYAADRFEVGQHHDVSSPEYDDHDNVTWEDAQYVRKMAEHPGQLPPLVVRPGGGIFGGGHRLAAWRDAGWTHAPAWVPDSQRTAAAGEHLLASFDWSGLTHGRYDVPTGAVHALRQHDDLNSGKHPHLADEIAERGIEQPLEVSLHDDGRVVLRGGSHRVNIAHSLGHPTVPVQVVDMRTRHTAAAASPDGMREDWHPGDRAHYEYHCYEAHDSSDAELWYRSHQQVHVLGRGEDEDLDAPLHERLEEGMPRVYQVRFGDGHEGDATEDELLTHPRHFTRPDPPARPKTAKVWAPNQGIFGPTTGLDTRLFGGEELRPEVRRDLMERLDRALRVDTQLVGSEWQDYLRVYIAGGSASEWAGGRPNETAQDLDVLIGVDYQAARGHAFEGMYDEQIDAALNAALR